MNIDAVDYWAAVYDREPKVRIHIDGDKIHSFFDIRGILKFGSGARSENGITDQVVDLPIEVFLGLAEPIPQDDHKRHSASSADDFMRDMVNGKDFGWTLPYLTLMENEDEVWKVIGHDGRHRAKLLQMAGFEELPVHLVFATPLSKNHLPKNVRCQNDCGRQRDKYVYDFPVTAENYGEPYFAIDRDPENWQEKGEAKLANVKDEVNLKFKPLCPKANEEARNNYLKDKETNPYKRDASVPYSTFSEFLKIQDKLALGKEERGKAS